MFKSIGRLLPNKRKDHKGQHRCSSFDLVFSRKADALITAMVDVCPTEFMFDLMVKRVSENRFEVFDIFIHYNNRMDPSFSQGLFSESNLDTWCKNMVMYGLMDRETARQHKNRHIHGSMHSHVNMSAFFSGYDLTFIQEHKHSYGSSQISGDNEFGQFSVFAVVNKRGEHCIVLCIGNAEYKFEYKVETLDIDRAIQKRYKWRDKDSLPPKYIYRCMKFSISMIWRMFQCVDRLKTHKLYHLDSMFAPYPPSHYSGDIWSFHNNDDEFFKNGVCVKDVVVSILSKLNGESKDFVSSKLLSDSLLRKLLPPACHIDRVFDKIVLKHVNDMFSSLGRCYGVHMLFYENVIAQCDHVEDSPSFHEAFTTLIMYHAFHVSLLYGKYGFLNHDDRINKNIDLDLRAEFQNIILRRPVYQNYRSIQRDIGNYNMNTFNTTSSNYYYNDIDGGELPYDDDELDAMFHYGIDHDENVWFENQTEQVYQIQQADDDQNSGEPDDIELDGSVCDSSLDHEFEQSLFNNKGVL